MCDAEEDYFEYLGLESSRWEEIGAAASFFFRKKFGFACRNILVTLYTKESRFECKVFKRGCREHPLLRWTDTIQIEF